MNQPDYPIICLHEHADGSIRLDTFMELAGRGTKEARKALYAMTKNGLAGMFHQAAWSGDLARCLKVFSLTAGVMQTPEAITRVLREQVIDAHKSGVVYLESRLAPSILRQQGLTLDEVVEAALVGLQQGEAATGIKTGLILCALRGWTDSVAIAKLAARWQGKNVAGFDIAGGPEQGHRVSEYAEALRIADRAGLGVCPHVGEADGSDAIKDALKTTKGMARVRFGHALSATDRQIEEMTKRGILIEANITSNLATGLVARRDLHPAGRWIKMGAPVVLNTDDGGETIFKVTHREEYNLASRALGLSEMDLQHCLDSGLRGAFAESEKLMAVREKIAELTNRNNVGLKTKLRPSGW